MDIQDNAQSCPSCAFMSMSAFSYLPTFLLEESFQFLLAGQFKLVLGNKKTVIHVGSGVFHQGVVFLRAEKEPHRRIVSIGHHMFAIPRHIGVELPQVFMAEGVHFEFNEDMAFKDAMVENEIHKASGFSYDDALLPGFETKPIAQFQQEFMQVVQEGIFKPGFAYRLAGFEPKKFKDVGIADGELGFGPFSDSVSHFSQFFLVRRRPDRS
jgi:hypothetical protein